MPIDADAITDEIFSKAFVGKDAVREAILDSYGRGVLDGMVRIHALHKEVTCSQQ
jgi:hypothetical protein